MLRKVIAVVVLLAAGAFVYTQITVFAVPPIGAAPEGATLILWRGNANLQFIDSPDGFCARHSDRVTLLCRGVALAGVAEHTHRLARLPYMDFLYLWSTDGARYRRTVP